MFSTALAAGSALYTVRGLAEICYSAAPLLLLEFREHTWYQHHRGRVSPRPIVEWPALSEHERLLVLQRLLADFAQEQPEEVVARTMLDRILPFIGASAGSVYVLCPDGQTLVMTAAYGPSREQVQNFGRVPLQARFPCADVMRAGQSAWYESTEALFAPSHELRTPLTSLKLQHQLLSRSLAEPAKAPRRLEAAERQVQRMAALVENLLDVSRIAAGKLELHPSKVDVAQAVQDAAERFSELFSQAGCTLVLDAQGPLHSWCDPLRLEQVLTNLLSNAAKYGAGQPVHVRATGSEQEVWISVRDQGIGIASQDLPRLFQRFERVVSSHHYGGLGLGLYISRQLVGAMGGSIHVESRLGEGTHFLVTLPRGHPDPSAPERQGLAGQSAEGSSRRA